ncbi:unnamed protein product [Mytilus coruscus]|uniref:Uncharacterized protein n=1 Tax=Mytilus coruscus TaxID=42192 RepID=A0A6J8EQC8_MYTCO|nr:unnamed protein product [Mytilus coruscus]
MPPPPQMYAPTLVPLVIPLFSEEAPSTVCLDELNLFIAEPILESTNDVPIVSNDYEYIIPPPEICTAPSVCSFQSTFEPKQFDVLSLLIPDEYSPELKAPSVNAPCVDVSYIPTPKNTLQLKAMADCQKSRIILNVRGSRFETCVPTLQQDPSAILSYMILKDSP